jgi:ribose transport system permease protein
VRRFIADPPLVPLVLLLVALVVVLQILRPGIVNERWIANTVKFAIPLALLAGCQTLAMLTGGIDLSAAPSRPWPPSSSRPRAGTTRASPSPRLRPGRAHRRHQRHRRRRLPRASADHDLGTSLIGTGCLQVYQRTVIAPGPRSPTPSPGSAPA